MKGKFVRATHKYHLEHFTCSECPLSLLKEDSYYERDNQLYCKIHYAQKFAQICAGCQGFITNEYVEVMADTSMELWHTNCFTLFKSWDIKLLKDGQESSESLDTKIQSVLNSLKNFEDVSAECVSNILSHFANLDYVKATLQVKRFLQCIECLYFSIYSVELEAARISEESQVEYKEAKLLSRRIMEFLSILSSTKDPGNRDFAAKELIPLVSNLAYSLKVVLKIGLKEALILDIRASTDVFMQFITLLDSGSIFPRYGDDSLNSGMHRECRSCNKPAEEDCWGISSTIWHSYCLKCSICKATYSENSKEFLLRGNQLICSKHDALGFDRLGYISRLEHYSHLLVLALKRVCIMTNTPFPNDNSEAQDESEIENDVSDILSASSSATSSSESLCVESIQTPVLLDRVARESSSDSEEVSESYLCDLYGYKLMMVKQLAALKLHTLLSEYFSLNDLMNLAKYQKFSIWSKVLQKLRPIVSVKKKAYFGAPLELQIENFACKLNVGPHLVRNRQVPILLRNIIKALLKSDLQAEGIFRKNGNIKKLKAFAEGGDIDPQNLLLEEESSIQLAALLKKYFRDLPDPLLTRKLFRVFIATQKLETESKRLEALHYVLCLLPRPNLEVLIVLTWFLKHISIELEDDDGNQMDVNSICTIFAPSLLSHTKNEVCLPNDVSNSISVLNSIILFQDDLWKVPDVIIKCMEQNQSSNDPQKSFVDSRTGIFKYYRNEIVKIHKSRTHFAGQSLETNRDNNAA